MNELTPNTTRPIMFSLCRRAAPENSNVQRDIRAVPLIALNELKSTMSNDKIAWCYGLQSILMAMKSPYCSGQDYNTICFYELLRPLPDSIL